ncbi:hypothetical protein QCA50_002746 [Cerrena zonata]|uniref:Mitochondrial escape protein 2 n=1 Tax=Cerrena zonata TaxID=2478898 RepID=A0AAW0GIQ3_9APHY
MSLSKSSVAISHNILQTARLAARHTSKSRVQLSHLRHQTRQYSEALASTSSESTDPSERNTNREGWLFVDSVFPVKLGTWDVRYYLGYFREETLLERLHALLKDVNNHGFRIIELEPQLKDGGVFIKFGYDSGNADVALEEILSDVRNTVAQGGGVPSWAGMSLGDVWLVKGNPWREDLMRYPSPIVKITFEGPDVDEETLYSLLRPYGRMGDIVPPSPVPAGTLRSSTVLFRNIRGAVRARNTLHGLMISSPNSTTKTRLKTSYQAPVQAHAIRNYITSHPRIFLPVLFFILGTFTYTIFDPIRVFMVEGKMQDWFDIRQFKLYQWLRTNTVDRFTDDHAADDGEKKPSQQQTWKERMDAQDALQRYLSDMPNTIVFLHGPQGSGKSSMLGNILRENGRKTLIIDVGALSKATSESALVTGLASQTGYWPVFSFLNSMNNLIDLASVGVIGQKTGLSSSISDQLKQILEVVGTGLKRVNTSYKQQQEDKRKKEELDQVRREQEAHISRRIKEGTWHDGRLDCLAGNGIMSELGIGDEWFSAQDADAPSIASVDEKGDRSEYLTSAEEAKRRQQNTADLQAYRVDAGCDHQELRVERWRNSARGVTRCFVTVGCYTG